jgi:hypothetical protein
MGQSKLTSGSPAAEAGKQFVVMEHSGDKAGLLKKRKTVCTVFTECISSLPAVKKTSIFRKS